MKAKVIIEDGITTIVLTPQNEFESNLIETIKNNEKNHAFSTKINVDNLYNTPSNHKISISIEKIKKDSHR